MLILILLSTILSTQMSKGNSADEESASLLGYANGDSNDTKTSNGKSSYGSITITAEGEAADLEYEAEDQRKHQERMQVVEKRLQAEGNWFTYDPRSQPHSISSSTPKVFSPASICSPTADIVYQGNQICEANLQVDILRLLQSLRPFFGLPRIANSRQNLSECVFASSVFEL